MKSAAVLVIFLGYFSMLNTPAAYAQEDVPAGVIIRSITIKNTNIFDQSKDSETGFLYRAANGLHRKTRDVAVSGLLLFREGEELSQRLLDESERKLRSAGYIRSAKITYTQEANFADVLIVVSDTWTTKPIFRYSHKGGDESSEMGLQEDNFLGYGIELSLLYKNEDNRKSTIVSMFDPNLRGTRHQLGIGFANSSDGYTNHVSFAKPFYELNSRASHGMSIFQEERTENLYFLNAEYFQYQLEEQNFDFYRGWSNGLIETKTIRHRLGVKYLATTNTEIGEQPTDIPEDIAAYISANDMLPEDQKDVLPYYEFEYLTDKYLKTENYDKIGLTEDIPIGPNGRVKIGYSAQEWGSSQNRWYLDASLSDVFSISDKASVSISGALKTWVDESGLDDSRSTLKLQLRVNESHRLKLFAEYVQVDLIHPSKGEKLYLGGDNGMRGYPTRHLSGEHSQLFRIEQRLYTGIELFGLFNIGAAAFYDYGRVRGGTPFDRLQNSHSVESFGIGLRAANSRTSSGEIIHIDIAKALARDDGVDEFQLVIEARRQF